MSIADAYGSGRFGLSFELFPPKTAEALVSLEHHVAELANFKPSYITCTYGAGGSTQDRTLEVISGVRKRHNLPVATHLTCVGRTPPELHAYLTKAAELGVDNVVALRGDPPKGEASFRPVDGGFRYANELVAFIRNEFPKTGIAVGGYPETHQEALDAKTDLANLKRKIDAGADVIITQLFYNNEDFYRFRDRCAVALRREAPARIHRGARQIQRRPRRPVRSRRRLRHPTSRRPQASRHPRHPFLRVE
jgi:methylenetetrahydrofolate reductase (NADPH)